MVEISDSLRLLYETTLEEHGDQYSISVPKELVDERTLNSGELFRVALLPSSEGVQTGGSNSESVSKDTRDTDRRPTGRPPVEEGEVRSVTIDTLGDQGDGIAKVERGFIVILPRDSAWR